MMMFSFTFKIIEIKDTMEIVETGWETKGYLDIPVDPTWIWCVKLTS